MSKGHEFWLCPRAYGAHSHDPLNQGVSPSHLVAEDKCPASSTSSSSGGVITVDRLARPGHPHAAERRKPQLSGPHARLLSKWASAGISPLKQTHLASLALGRGGVTHRLAPGTRQVRTDCARNYPLAAVQFFSRQKIKDALAFVFTTGSYRAICGFFVAVLSKHGQKRCGGFCSKCNFWNEVK